MKNILFRADSSCKIGIGHIMRDLVLASQYKDCNIVFATQKLNGNINHKIKEANYKIEILKSNDIKELNILIKKLKIDLLIIDHYNIDYKFEKKIKKKNQNLEIMSFDDTYEKHCCDILLNHNISAKKSKYKKLVPKNCELRCGSKYTLLRSEFIEEKKKSKKVKLLKKDMNIFIAMGGADHSNLNIDILKVLKGFKNIKVNVITTSANQNIEELKKYCKNKSWIKLYIDFHKIAKLMRKSDFAIVSPSVVVNEVYFMNLPFIEIKTAKNQEDMYRYLKKKDFLTMQKYKKTELKYLVENMISNLKGK